MIGKRPEQHRSTGMRRSRSGLWLPPAPAPRSLDELLTSLDAETPAGPVVAADGPLPIYVSASAGAVGLDTLDLSALRHRVAELPFGSSMNLLRQLLASLRFDPVGRATHCRAAHALLAGPHAERVIGWVASSPSHIAFDPRHVCALMRLLITDAADGPPDAPPSPSEQHRLGELLVLAGSALPDDPRLLSDEPQPDWVAWSAFVGRSSLWDDDRLAEVAIAWAAALLLDVHQSPELLSHPCRSDLDGLLRARTGLGIEQQLAGGVALARSSGALDASAGSRVRGGCVGRGFLAPGPMAAEEQALVDLISADREELRGALLAAGDGAMAVAWDHVLFDQRPFLRREDGRLELLDPRGLVRWLTRGLHFRLLEAAGSGLPDAAGRTPSKSARRRRSGDYLTYTGALGEVAVRRLVGGSLADAVKRGAAVVHGEHSYRVEGRTVDAPDVAVVLGQDVVLIEVYSGSLPRAARSLQEADELQAKLDRASTEKLAQLQRRVGELLAGQLRYSGLEPSAIGRVFPVVVASNESVSQSPMLWGYLRQHHPEVFSADERVRRTQLMDLSDLEALLALVEEGEQLAELLQTMLDSNLSEWPPRNWVHAHRQGISAHPAYLRQWGTEALARVARWGSGTPPSSTPG